jgi:predicted nucleic acid-binding protein
VSAEAFLDTNVLVYAFSTRDDRTASARQLLLDGAVVGVQALNEFASVARAKLGFTWAEVQEAVEKILILCPNPRSLSLQIHLRALDISMRYKYSIWDGLIVAAALDAGCKILYTEDLQHGQVVEGLRIENPFLGRMAHP